MKKRVITNQEPLEDSRIGDAVGGPYGREKSLRGFYYERSNDMGNKVKDEVAGALYQIHSFAKLIGDNYCDIISAKEKDRDGGISDPVLSFVNLVQEKAEFCLAAIDNDPAEVE